MYLYIYVCLKNRHVYSSYPWVLRFKQFLFFVAFLYFPTVSTVNIYYVCSQKIIIK